MENLQTEYLKWIVTQRRHERSQRLLRIETNTLIIIRALNYRADDRCQHVDQKKGGKITMCQNTLNTSNPWKWGRWNKNDSDLCKSPIYIRYRQCFCTVPNLRTQQSVQMFCLDSVFSQERSATSLIIHFVLILRCNK